MIVIFSREKWSNIIEGVGLDALLILSKFDYNWNASKSYYNLAFALTIYLIVFFEILDVIYLINLNYISAFKLIFKWYYYVLFYFCIILYSYV